MPSSATSTTRPLQDAAGDASPVRGAHRLEGRAAVRRDDGVGQGAVGGPYDLPALDRARVEDTGPPAPSAASAPAVRSSTSSATRVLGLGLPVHQAIDDPGRMSWNWWNRTVSTAGRSLVRVGVLRHVQRGRRRPQLGLTGWCSLLRLPCLVRACGGVGAAVQLQVEFADPDRGSGYSSRRARRRASGCSTTTFGEPSRSASLRARSMISRVGPPPPSPQPNGASERVATPFSW